MKIPESVLKYQHEIWQAIGETFVMVGISIAAAVLIGLPLGTLLYLFPERTTVSESNVVLCTR